MQPVILITLHRRYGDLQRAIRIYRELRSEFSVQPKLVLIWSTPEYGLHWLIDELHFDDIIYRSKLIFEGERGSTTYPESHNINIGLKYIKKKYGPDCYVIVQASDIIVKQGAYAAIDEVMQEKSNNVVVFHWENACVRIGCFHTNFFGVSMNEEYWPPKCNYDEHDTLEWVWGKRLRGYTSNYPFKWVQLNNHLFTEHNSPTMNFPCKSSIFMFGKGYDSLTASMNLTLCNKLSLWRKLWHFVISFVKEE